MPLSPLDALSERFGGKPLPLHYYLGLDERVNPLDELAIDGVTFYQACAMGRMDVIQVFLLSGFDINATAVGSGLAGLHQAAAAGITPVVELLLASGAKADVPSSADGTTPLMMALSGGHVDVVKLLISHGASATAKDNKGEPAVFYGAKFPVVLHTVKTMLGLDLAGLRNDAGETLLFPAARCRDGRNAVLYLSEMAGVDINATNSNGETALHVAARTNDIDLIKAFMAKGADPDARGPGGQTPATMRECSYGKLMRKCINEHNKSALERMTQPDASNWGRLTMTQVKHFLLFFTIPNIILYAAAFLPAYVGFLGLGCSAGGFMIVANFAMKQKDRSLATAGWFSGALTFGSYVLVSRIFPVFEKHDPHGTTLTGLWYLVTFFMYANYVKAVLADPGAVQSNAEARQVIIDAVAKEGQAVAKRENYDMTTLVRKPLRSKHCKKTHFTVCRFDHYCVWTGNAIAGGNHRPFVMYCLFQTVSQILVAYTTFSTLIWYGPVEAGAHVSGFFGTLGWMFTPPDNTLATYFLVFYNSFVFLFVSAVVFSQLWYATRNVTSNEVWFADRYPWMFTLGSRAYSMYDRGLVANVIDFFWSGNLCVENYVVPQMNDYLQTLTRQHAAKMRSQQAVGRGAYSGAISENDKSFDAPTSVSSGTGGDVAPQTPIDNSTGSPTGTGGDAITEMQMLLPQERQNEMKTLQAMIQQMMGGASEPTPPAHVTDEKERTKLVKKAKMMYRQISGATRAPASP